MFCEYLIQKYNFKKTLKPELSTPKTPTKKAITLADGNTFILHRVIFNSHTLFTNKQLQTIFPFH